MSAKPINEHKAPAAPDLTRRAPRIKVEDLLKGRQEMILEHEGHEYRLRITASGKLILTK